MHTYIRKLAILLTTLVFAVTSFGTANAQFFDPDGGGFGAINTGTGIFEDYEEWMEQCEGQAWECDWAWRDPDVMEQMLNPPPGHSIWSSLETGEETNRCGDVPYQPDNPDSIAARDAGMSIRDWFINTGAGGQYEPFSAAAGSALLENGEWQRTIGALNEAVEEGNFRIGVGATWGTVTTRSVPGAARGAAGGVFASWMDAWGNVYCN